MGREAQSEVTDVLGPARDSEEGVGAAAIGASDIVHFTGSSQSDEEGLAELGLRAKPLKNFEPIVVWQVEVKDYDRWDRKPFTVGEVGIAS